MNKEEDLEEGVNWPMGRMYEIGTKAMDFYRAQGCSADVHISVERRRVYNGLWLRRVREDIPVAPALEEAVKQGCPLRISSLSPRNNVTTWVSAHAEVAVQDVLDKYSPQHTAAVTAVRQMYANMATELKLPTKDEHEDCKPVDMDEEEDEEEDTVDGVDWSMERFYEITDKAMEFYRALGCSADVLIMIDRRRLYLGMSLGRVREDIPVAPSLEEAAKQGCPLRISLMAPNCKLSGSFRPRVYQGIRSGRVREEDPDKDYYLEEKKVDRPVTVVPPVTGFPKEHLGLALRRLFIEQFGKDYPDEWIILRGDGTLLAHGKEDPDQQRRRVREKFCVQFQVEELEDPISEKCSRCWLDATWENVSTGDKGRPYLRALLTGFIPPTVPVHILGWINEIMFDLADHLADCAEENTFPLLAPLTVHTLLRVLCAWPVECDKPSSISTLGTTLPPRIKLFLSEESNLSIFNTTVELYQDKAEVKSYQIPEGLEAIQQFIQKKMDPNAVALKLQLKATGDRIKARMEPLIEILQHSVFGAVKSVFGAQHTRASHPTYTPGPTAFMDWLMDSDARLQITQKFLTQFMEDKKEYLELQESWDQIQAQLK